MVMILFLGFNLVTVSKSQNYKDKEQFNVVVNLDYNMNNIDLASDSIDLKNVSSHLMNKVNELAKNKKFTVAFNGTENVVEGSVNLASKSNLILNLSISINNTDTKSGVDVFYADDNDFTFQSIKYANMVVSEIKSSKLNLQVNGMNESGLPLLKNATGPALQVEIKLQNTFQDKLILTNEDKLNALAKMIYSCIERISKS